MKNSNSLDALTASKKGEFHPPHLAIEKKIDEIEARDRAEREEIGNLTAELNSVNGAARITPQARRVSEMIGDTVGPDMTPKLARLRELQEIRPVNLAALDVLRSKLAIEHVVASKKVCDHYKDDHKRRVAKMFKATVALKEAVAEYEAMVFAFQNADIAWSSLRPMQPLWFGLTRDKDSAPNGWLKECAKFGFVNSSEVPQEIR